MPEYLSPGVYIQEVESGPRPIEGVGTAVAAFVGFAASGPANSPVLITNWSQYVNTFGWLEEGGTLNPHVPDVYLSHAVYGYFLNGGGRCYVTRMTGEQPARLPLPSRSSEDVPSLTITLKNTPRQNVIVDIIGPSSVVASPTAGKEGENIEQPKGDTTGSSSTVEPPTDGKKGKAVEQPKGDTTGSSSAVETLTDGKKGKAVEQPNQELFTLRVRMGKVEEEYKNLSMDKQSVKNAIAIVNQASRLITLTQEPSTGTLIECAPQSGSYTFLAATGEAPSTGTLAVRAPQSGSYTFLAAPENALPKELPSSNFQGNVAERSGLEGLEVAEDVTMVCCPDLMAAYEVKAIDRQGVKAVQLAMIAHCERMGDRIAILDPPPYLDNASKALSPQEVKLWREQETGYDSKFAVLYYPWIKIAGNGQPLAIPPCGHMAGIYARNDNERGVHKAPANEVVSGALEAVTQITKGEQDTLNPVGVNCIRSFTGRGLRVWGARTLSSDPAWRYVNVRRLFNYIEKSIERGTQWVVFEPNDADLWARVKRDVGAFLTGAWRDGMLFGSVAEEAFFVKCDQENNPPDVRDRGQLFIDIGLAPVKPAEFVIFRLSQWAGGGA